MRKWRMSLRWVHGFAVVCALLGAGVQAQTVAIDKIDPPNWWTDMPAVMLLVHGHGLQDAKFAVEPESRTLAQKTRVNGPFAALHVDRTVSSANGHWALLWLSASPAQAGAVTLEATAANGERARAVYSFLRRRPQGDGFAGFDSRDVMYLIMTDRFADGDRSNDGPGARSAATAADAAEERAKPRGWHGGDLRGIQKRLGYLQQLGVTTLWITPVYENHRFDSYHGYGATDMYRVDEHYGTLADLQALSAALHARGMKLVLDEVPNHVGPDHPWVRDEPLPDWFHGTVNDHLPGESNFAALLDPHAPRRDTRNTTDGWFVGLLPDMNTENAAVAQYLRQNVMWWVEQTAADGIRIDTFPYIARGFWAPYLGGLHALWPRLTEVGEAKSTDPVFTSSYAGGVTRAGADTRLWTPFDFPLDGALHDAFARGGPLTLVANVFAADALYPHPERLVTLLDNHDERRFRSEAASLAAMKMAMGVLLTARGLPQLYSGDELAMQGGDDPENRHDMPGGFAGDTRSVFTETGRDAEEREMYAWTARLAALRKAHPALACGLQEQELAAKDTLVYARVGGEASTAAGSGGSASCGNGSSGDERLLVAVGRGPAHDETLQLGLTRLAGCRTWDVLLGDALASLQTQGDAVVMHLAADDVLVARCR